jgi:cytochrome c
MRQILPAARRSASAVGAALAFFAPFCASGGDGRPHGQALFQSLGCVACHGSDGSHPVSEDYPVIAGQNAPYLLTQMKDIRDGRRANGLSETMRVVIDGARDEDLAVIAEWLSKRW